MRGRRTPALTLLALVAVAVASCSKPVTVTAVPGYPGPRTEPADSDEPAAGPSATAKTMHQRFARVADMRDAMVYGDLEEARHHADELRRDLERDDDHESWREHITQLRGSLDALDATKDPAEAAQTVAEIGSRCGACHVALEVSATVPDPPPPARAANSKARMSLHRWAAARMWEGLVLPSDDEWVRGTTTFLELPGCQEAYPDAAGPRRELCRYVARLAIPAHLARDQARKTELYGRLLATCAQCHAVEP